jgi:hypothetical protein
MSKHLLNAWVLEANTEFENKEREVYIRTYVDDETRIGAKIVKVMDDSYDHDNWNVYVYDPNDTHDQVFDDMKNFVTTSHDLEMGMKVADNVFGLKLRHSQQCGRLRREHLELRISRAQDDLTSIIPRISTDNGLCSVAMNNLINLQADLIELNVLKTVYLRMMDTRG